MVRAVFLAFIVEITLIELSFFLRFVPVNVLLELIVHINPLASADVFFRICVCLQGRTSSLSLSLSPPLPLSLSLSLSLDMYIYIYIYIYSKKCYFCAKILDIRINNFHPEKSSFFYRYFSILRPIGVYPLVLNFLWGFQTTIFNLPRNFRRNPK